MSSWKRVISTPDNAFNVGPMLDQYCDTSVGLAGLGSMEPISEDLALVAIKGSADQEVGLSLLITAPEYKLLPLAGCPFGVGDVERIRACGDGTSAVVLVANVVWKVTVALSSGQPTMTAAKLLDLPPNVNEISMEWSSSSTWPGPTDGLVVAVLEDKNPPLDPDAPFLADLAPRALSLSKYSSSNGWEDVCTVPATSNGLQTSRNGAMCSFTVMTNPIPEEAERGEYWICELAKGATAAQITVGAGRVVDGGGSLLSPDGGMLVFSANFSLTKPITTTCDLWMVKTGAVKDGGGSAGVPLQHQPQAPTNITAGKSVLDFNWVLAPPGAVATDKPFVSTPPQLQPLNSRYRCVDARGVAVREAPSESSERSTGPLYGHMVEVSEIVLGDTAGLRYLRLANGNGYLPLESPTPSTPPASFCFQLVPPSKEEEEAAAAAAVDSNGEPKEVAGAGGAADGGVGDEGAGEGGDGAAAAATATRRHVRLWITYVHNGIERKSETFLPGTTRNSIHLQPPITTEDCISLGPANNQLCCYGTESGTDYPSMIVLANPNGIEIQLPHKPKELAVFNQLRMVRVEWTAKDGTPLVGAIYERVGLPATAPLLVHAHGGPAIMLPCDRSAAANTCRYPYRHLLLAGYRVFTPLFRGTLGFGPEFALANYRCQGDVENGDLGDIVQGIESMHQTGQLNCMGSIGIFGGSYGGYMTIRAMSSTDMFACGVAMYGFVMNRWMSYEGGDFTWEDEYFGDREKWPVPAATLKSDTFNSLDKITKPMLLLHGRDDDICPLSQSYPAYNSLKTRNVPTGLIIYPGEGQ